MFCGVILTSWGEGASIYILGWPPLQWWRNNKSTLLGICFITLISHTTHIFLVGWLKFHLNCYFSWDWLREMNTGSSCYSCWCLSFFGLLRPDLSPWRYRNRRFLTALLFLIVNTPNLKVATKRHLHQWVKEQGYYECHATHRNVSLRCFLWFGYFGSPWVLFVTTDEFSVRITKITSRIGVSQTQSWPFWFWPLLKSLKWSYYQKDIY